MVRVELFEIELVPTREMVQTLIRELAVETRVHVSVNLHFSFFAVAYALFDASGTVAVVDLIPSLRELFVDSRAC